MRGTRSAKAVGLVQQSALLLLAWCAAAHAAAQQPSDQAAAAGGEVGAARPCEPDSSCWDFAFLWSDDHALLGLTTTFSAALLEDEQLFDVSALVRYSVETHRASGWLNGHVSLRAALGAGSAGNEGVLAGGIDFGIRVPVTQYSGPVLRLGPSGAWVGNDSFELRWLEPLRATLGFQSLVGKQLLEGGLTAGLASTGRFRVATDATGLSGALELGTYLAARFEQLRVSGQALRVAEGLSAGAALGLLRIEACTFMHGLAISLCADALYAQAALQGAGDQRRLGRVVYAGFTAGFTP